MRGDTTAKLMLAVLLGFYIGVAAAVFVPRPEINDRLALAQFQAQAPLTLVRVETWTGVNPRVYILNVGNHRATGVCWLIAAANTACQPMQPAPDLSPKPKGDRR